MQKISFMLACILFVYHCSGQEIDFTFQRDVVTKAKFIAQAPNGNLMVAGGFGSLEYYEFEPLVFLLDEKGKLIFEYDATALLEWWEVGTTHSAIPLADGSFLINIDYGGCDFGANRILAKISQEGQTIWFKNSEQGDAVGWFDLLAEVPGGDLLAVVRNEYLVRYDQEGNLLWSKSLNLNTWQGNDHITGILVPNDYDIILCGSFDGYGLLHIDENGWKLPTFSDVPPLLHFSKFTDHSYVALSDSMALKLKRDPWGDFFVTGFLNLQPFGKFQDLKVDVDGVFLAGKNQDDVNIFLHLDTSLQVVSQFEFGDTLTVLEDFLLNEDEIILAGWKKIPPIHDYFLWGGPEGASLFVKSIKKNGGVLLPKQDVAVTGITFGTPPVLGPGWCPVISPPCHPVNISFTQVMVTVKNEGLEKLDSLSLNARFERCEDLCSICYFSETFNQHFVNLDIAPGESKTLTINDFRANNQDSILEQRLCIWASAPNGKSDANPQNDYFCEIFTTVPWKKELESSNLSVFPNPTSGLLNLQIDQIWKGELTLRMLNFIGQPIFEETISLKEGKNKWQSDLSSFPTGAYVLEIYSEEGQKLGKVKVVKL